MPRVDRTVLSRARKAAMHYQEDSTKIGGGLSADFLQVWLFGENVGP